MHTFFVNAGGDWEFPICFVLYNGTSGIRAYIPEKGNVYNKKRKCAYGSENDEEEDYDEDIVALEFNQEEIFNDILNRIKLKK